MVAWWLLLAGLVLIVLLVVLGVGVLVIQECYR